MPAARYRARRAGLPRPEQRPRGRPAHGKLRRHAARVRDRLDNVLNPCLDPASVPVTGLLAGTGHTTDLHAARFAQQMDQLSLVLDSYQAAVRHTGNVTSRS
ncbi:hypothetical protein [Streptomyces sp. NPDC054783]